ncbi:unnamed protein product [Boreogadus saida]
MQSFDPGEGVTGTVYRQPIPAGQELEMITDVGSTASMAFIFLGQAGKGCTQSALLKFAGGGDIEMFYLIMSCGRRRQGWTVGNGAVGLRRHVSIDEGEGGVDSGLKWVVLHRATIHLNPQPSGYLGTSASPCRSAGSLQDFAFQRSHRVTGNRGTPEGSPRLPGLQPCASNAVRDLLT